MRFFSSHAVLIKAKTQHTYRPISIIGMMVAGALVLSACSVETIPITLEERDMQAETDLAAIFEHQEPISDSLTLPEAIARAIKYNLDHRMLMMEEAVAQNASDLTSYDMLPRLVTSAGYTARSDLGGKTSKDLSDGSVGTSYSTGNEHSNTTVDLSMAWNVLDFGVSYVTARQMANQVHASSERRRKVIHNIIQEVRAAYWRASSAEMLVNDLTALTDNISKGIAQARETEEEGLQPKLESLEYQKLLLEILVQLSALNREVVVAKTELSRLMALDLSTPYKLEGALGPSFVVPEIPVELANLSQYALQNRPELFQEDYQKRISADEVEKAFLRLLPGLELTAAQNYDNNTYLQNSLWATAGLQLTWNVMNLISAPDRLKQAEMETELGDARRMALSMAIIAQVQLSHRRFIQAKEDFKIASDLYGVDQRIYDHVAAGFDADTQSELEFIRRDAARVFSRARHNQSYARMMGEESMLYLSIGIDPLPNLNSEWSVSYLTAQLEQSLRGGNENNDSVDPQEIDVEINAVTSDIATPEWQITDQAVLGDEATDLSALNLLQQDMPSSDYILHLGSYRSLKMAELGWETLVESFQSLKQISKLILEADVETKGHYFRLYGEGPRQDLTEICTSLKAQLVYCEQHKRPVESRAVSSLF